jgi:hypothetical protein
VPAQPGADPGQHRHRGLGRAVRNFGAKAVQAGRGGGEDHSGVDGPGRLGLGPPVSADDPQQPEGRDQVDVEEQAEVMVAQPEDRPGTQHAEANARSALVDGKPDQQRRSGSDGARHFDRPAERVNAVGEANESGTAGGIGPAATIVADRKLEDSVTCFDGDMHRGGVRVLRGIRERF